MNEDGQDACVGLDVHRDTIAVAVAPAGRDAPEFRGEIRNDSPPLRRLIRRLGRHDEALSLCYEANPCGYGTCWQIQELGHWCEVVAPSLIPRKPGERVKTDRRDALKLVRLHRGDDLTPPRSLSTPAAPARAV